VVNHSAKEYVRGLAHTNTVEGFYSIFKRGMKSVYQHCAELGATKQRLRPTQRQTEMIAEHRLRLGTQGRPRQPERLSRQQLQPDRK
jgi:hypothetical protein